MSLLRVIQSRIVRRTTLVLIAGMSAVVTLAQDLPPGVLLLSQVKRHVDQELKNLPNISCLETIDREYQPPNGKMRPLDRVRLEVLTDGQNELFASPGERNFSAKHPVSYVGSGGLGNGFFGMYLKTVLFGNVSNQYKGEEEIGGRRLARYDYSLPARWSGQTITVPEGSGSVGLHGSYWADQETRDVLRLDLNADEFPPGLPVTEMAVRINYSPTRLRDDLVVLLPDSAYLRLVKLSGEIQQNRIGFTHCQVFSAESTINFSEVDSAPKPARSGAASVDDTLRPMAKALQIAVKLHTRITGELAVGALIEGEVASTVERKGAAPIPAGSPVRGRIRRLERFAEPSPYFIVALEFTELEIEGARYRFSAEPVDIGPGNGVETKLSFEKHESSWEDIPMIRGSGLPVSVSGNETRRSSWDTVTAGDLPGVATFFVRGDKLDLRPGFRTVWRTLAP